MKQLLSNELGGLLLIFVVVVAVGGLAGTLGTRAAMEREQARTAYLDALANGSEITDEMQDSAMTSTRDQFQIMGATGNLINSVDVSPDRQSAVSAYAMGAMGNAVDQGSRSAPSSDNRLPDNVRSNTGADTSNGSSVDQTAVDLGCQTGLYICNSGQNICAELVCNGSANCADGSDEDAEQCGQADNCCVATRGCPMETGSECAETCCCCGYGEVCDQNNWANGCVSAGASSRRNILRTFIEKGEIYW
jgi:hypothetical protein